jgi:protein involved in polysaccharide export with SLBB domain
MQARDTLHVYSIWDIQDRYQVEISGEVRHPGAFDWREGMTLRDLLLKAGGFTDGADNLHAEVARLKLDAVEQRDPGTPPGRVVDVLHVELGDDWLAQSETFELQPHDRVAVRRLPWWQVQRAVLLRGEVAYPGKYVLDRPDERLSSVVERAGGLKPTAYAEGARIMRVKDGVGNIALDLEKALDDPGSEHDAILASGDKILVPPVPYTVKVTGAVNFPTSVIWESGSDFGDYVGRAGGYAENADKWKSHVVYANGMSKPIRHYWFDPKIRPGSTIVVPVKPPEDGTSKLATLKEISSIVASVATVWLVIDRTN